MSTLFWFLSACAVSGLAIVYLLLIDDKRIRAFRLSRPRKLPAYKGAGWMLLLSPGLILPMTGQLSAFLSWFGAVTLLGWLVAMKQPKGMG